MLIEDCEADNYLHKKIIADVGAADEVITMRCGEDALHYINSNKDAECAQPDLIFVDINTPGMEGWDFVEEFEKFDNSIKSSSVIVMLSGSLNPDDRARAKAMPLIKEYRTKPLTRSVMREILEKHFGDG